MGVTFLRYNRLGNFTPTFLQGAEEDEGEYSF